jgi:hypothetical protein
MTTDVERIRASLSQTKIGTEALVLCVAQVLCQRDASFRSMLEETLDEAYKILEHRGDHEAAAMIGQFGRALIDPAFKPPSH